MPRKNVPISYHARDFDSIKASLVEHAKRYYADTFKDFNEAGFGALTIDTIAYTGDILSFYLDYQANESFLDSANEFDNILRHAKPLGFKLQENPSSHGVVTLFLMVQADSEGLGPDSRYIPILKKNSVFSARNGNNFTLTEDVFFSNTDNEVVVARANPDTGLPTSYAIRAYGKVVSGRLEETFLAVGDYEKFRKVEVDISNVAEVILVEDDEGHEYFEVDYLSQDVVYRPVLNRTGTGQNAPDLLKPFTVPRRYVVDRINGAVHLQFGHGADDTERTSERIVDPSRVVLDVHGRTNVPDVSFDPSNLVKTDKFGLTPSNTTLRVVVRANTTGDVNAGQDTVVSVSTANFEFTDSTTLDNSLKNAVRASLEVTNEDPIVGDVSLPNAEELKIRVFNSFAAQNRAVTLQDYIALTYRMPSEFGAVKRVNVVRDPDSFKRNLNLYVVSEDEDGSLAETTSTIKENLKVWLNKNRMINDTIDILDAKIVNLGVHFSIIGDLERDKYDILADANFALGVLFSQVKDVGEALFITDIYEALKNVAGVVDVTKVKIFQKTGGAYSDIRFNVNEQTSADGRYIEAPQNVIFEVRFPNDDVKGVVR